MLCTPLICYTWIENWGIIESHINLIKAANKPDHLGEKVYIESCKTDFAKIAELCWDHIITYWLGSSIKFDHLILDF